MSAARAHQLHVECGFRHDRARHLQLDPMDPRVVRPGRGMLDRAAFGQADRLTRGEIQRRPLEDLGGRVSAAAVT